MARQNGTTKEGATTNGVRATTGALNGTPQGALAGTDGVREAAGRNGADPLDAAPLAWSLEESAGGIEAKKYKAFQLHNFRDIPQVDQYLTQQQVFDIEVVARVFPFKTNSYVVDELIRWEDVPNDPMFVLTFPQRGMLKPDQYDRMAAAVRSGDEERMKETAHEIRMECNPHPAGQMEHNVPDLLGEKLEGMQHKYRETVLFFPSQGQTCHAYCSFCFRWPQFVEDDMKFAMKEVDKLVDYLKENPGVTDVLFTGGDPMVMSPRLIKAYLEPLIEARESGEVPNLRTVRIGSKSLTYWPYKYVTDKGADEVLDVFQRVADSGLHLAFMAHFNHPVELSTPAVKKAIRNIRATGAVVRSQTPLLANINDDPQIWAQKWQAEVENGVIPYYMFVVRDTGAQHYFGISLVRAWEIYREAYQHVSGLARTVRGPSMSADPGKVEMLGPTEIRGEKVMAFRFLQGRDPDWVDRTFFAKYDEDAIWLNDLEPAFGESEWFWTKEFAEIYADEGATGTLFQEEAPIPEEAPSAQ